MRSRRAKTISRTPERSPSTGWSVWCRSTTSTRCSCRGDGEPGQVANGTRCRAFVRSFVQSGKPVASICHGPWNFVEADVARGRRLTSWPSVRTDLRNAGAEVVDEPVVTDGNITTSRSPDDLPAFSERIVQEFAKTPQSAGPAGPW